MEVQTTGGGTALTAPKSKLAQGKSVCVYNSFEHESQGQAQGAQDLAWMGGGSNQLEAQEESGSNFEPGNLYRRIWEVSTNSGPVVVKGRLRSRYQVWEELGANRTIVGIITHGYRIPFFCPPHSVHLRNNLSARKHGEFVETAITELLTTGRVREVDRPPWVVNPLSVSTKGDKNRLILDLRHVNQFVIKQKIKFDDWKVMEHFLTPQGYLFSFDIKQGYHHIEMAPDSVEYLGFSWNFNGEVRFFVFLVLPFGLTSAPFIFTKIIRVLIKYWRGQGVKICCFIDDGCGAGEDQVRALEHSELVQDTLVKAGFLTNDKSVWEPTQELTWIGYTVDLHKGIFRVADKRVTSLMRSIHNITAGLPYTSARQLSRLTGKIISTKWVVGDITHLKTRHLYSMIESRIAWDKRMSVNHYREVISELVFWKNNFTRLNVKHIRPYCIPDLVVASDASATGLGAHAQVGTRELIVRKNFSPEEADTSSTHREVYAILYALASYKALCIGKSVLWFTDNFGASRVVPKGSGVRALQEMAESIHNICDSNRIDLRVQWVPREAIYYADHLSKLVDHDDWCTTPYFFRVLDQKWGPFSVDRFADNNNTKLKRFNSKYLCPNTEHVDAFTLTWEGENNYLVPPVGMVPRVLAHMAACHGRGVMVVPYWPSAAFFPLVSTTGNEFKGFVWDWMRFPAGQYKALVQGPNKGVFIGSEVFKSDVLALALQF